MTKSCCKEHPDHTDQTSRLNRISGQLEGVKKMIAERRYCVDILTQLKAVRAAIQGVESNILELHMRQCLEEACARGDKVVIEDKINELLKLLKSY